MRCVLTLVVATAALYAQAPAQTTINAETEAKRADIRKLLVALGSGDQISAQFRSQMEAYRGKYPQLPQAFWDSFIKETSPQVFIEMFIPIYEKDLTHAEVRAYLEFVTSPSGASVIKKLPSVNTEAVEAARQWASAFPEKLNKELHPEGKK